MFLLTILFVLPISCLGAIQTKQEVLPKKPTALEKITKKLFESPEIEEKKPQKKDNAPQEVVVEQEIKKDQTPKVADRRKRKKKKEKPVVQTPKPTLSPTAQKLISRSKIAIQETKLKLAAQAPKPVKLTVTDKRKRKSSIKKAQKITMRDMTYEELSLHKNQYIVTQDYETAIKYIEKMMPLCPDLPQRSELALELADLTFESNSFEKAGKIYLDFIKFYPGNEMVEYAYYKAILCSADSILDAMRDQTKTKDTLELIGRYLERQDVFTQYKNEILNLQKLCYQRLAENEFSIIEFYTNHKNFKAVHNRLEGLKKDYVNKIPEIKANILVCEIDMAKKQNNLELAQAKLEELQTSFPAYKQNTNTIAVAQVEKKSFMNRF
jgi:outer membrane assembly lipoprotein YfiO